MASITERLKYSLNSQNPGSLTCEKAIEPQGVRSGGGQVQAGGEELLQYGEIGG